MKKFVCYLLSVISIFSFGFSAMAYDNSTSESETSSEILKSENQNITETLIGKGLKKKEKVIYLKYDYDGDFKNNDYQYKTVRVETTYFDNKNDNKVIAVAYMEFNFRYNKKLNEAKCLSTSHGQICNDSNYELKVFARSKNLSYEIGESFGEIVLTKKKSIISKQKDKSNIMFCCDKSGNIAHRIHKT